MHVNVPKAWTNRDPAARQVSHARGTCAHGECRHAVDSACVLSSGLECIWHVLSVRKVGWPVPSTVLLVAHLQDVANGIHAAQH
jgi:hypothetical protein